MAALYFAERVADGPGVARAARGPARGRGDEHPGQPAEAAWRSCSAPGSPASPGSHLRRRSRPASSPATSTSALLITIYAIVILGGARQPRRRRGRRDRHQRAFRFLALRRRRSTRAGSSTACIVARAVAQVRPVRRSLALVARARSRSASPCTRSRTRSGRAGRPGPRSARVALAQLRSTHWVLIPADPTKIANWAYVILVALILVLPGKGSWRTVASCRPSTSPRSSGRTSSSEQPAVDALILLRRAARRADERAAAGPLGTARVEIV